MIIRLLRLLKDLDYVQVMDQILKYQIFQKHGQNWDCPLITIFSKSIFWEMSNW